MRERSPTDLNCPRPRPAAPRGQKGSHGDLNYPRATRAPTRGQKRSICPEGPQPENGIGMAVSLRALGERCSRRPVAQSAPEETRGRLLCRSTHIHRRPPARIRTGLDRLKPGVTHLHTILHGVDDDAKVAEPVPPFLDPLLVDAWVRVAVGAALPGVRRAKRQAPAMCGGLPAVGQPRDRRRPVLKDPPAGMRPQGDIASESLVEAGTRMPT